MYDAKLHLKCLNHNKVIREKNLHFLTQRVVKLFHLFDVTATFNYMSRLPYLYSAVLKRRKHFNYKVKQVKWTDPTKSTSQDGGCPFCVTLSKLRKPSV